MKPVALSLLVCLGAAALESAFAGGGVRRRFAELQLPSYSPPFALWIVIGVLYYALCFLLLWHLLSSAQPTARHIGAFIPFRTHHAVQFRMEYLVLPTAHASW
jgi:tryptophan-rich sensory protein